MKFKLYFVCILSCFALLFASCNEATPEQIEETELAIKKEKLLEEMHEQEVKELVNALSEKAKDNSFYYFVNLGKDVEKVKDDPYYNIFNVEKGYALQLLTKKIKEIPEYTQLYELHKEYHKSKILELISDEDLDEYYKIKYKEFNKWNIVDNKIKSEKGIGKSKLIENTICPFCRPLIDEANNYQSDFRYNDYLLEYYAPCDRTYFKKYKLFGYYLNNPQELIDDYEKTIQYVSKYFGVMELPLQSIGIIIDNYNKKIEALEKEDEFGLNGAVESYKKSLKGKEVKIKAKIQNIEEVTLENKNDASEPYWKMTIYDDVSGYEMKIYFSKKITSSSLGGLLPTSEDMKKIKKNMDITFVTQLYIGEPKEVYYNLLFFKGETDLHFGYSEILEIK